MQRIVTIAIGERKIQLFSDVFSVHATGAPSHAHRYPELHVFLSGTGVYTVAGLAYRLLPGDVILIPSGTLHETACSPDARIMAFEADVAAERVSVLRLPEAIVRELDDGAGGSLDALIPAFYYLFARVVGVGTYSVSANQDYAYLIDAYIEKNYHRTVRLSELAAVLCLSERQTQRVIREITGGTFGELLTSHRLAVAERLRATTKMTQAEIAAYVGFSTYSGFRRAERRLAQEK